MAVITRWVKAQLGSFPTPLFDGPVLVVVHFRIPAPLGLNEKRRAAQHQHPCTKKPDADNIEKFLSDALNRLIWQDDKLNCVTFRTKTLTKDKVGSITLYVRELPSEALDYEAILKSVQENVSLD